MGKKATFLLTRILFCTATLLLSAIAILAWLAGIIPPEKSWFIAFMALGMTPLLILNFVFLVIWVIRRKWWALIPLAAILFNTGYILAMYQFDFRSLEDLKKPNLTVATYNIHGQDHNEFGGVLQGALDYFDTEGVDIVAIQEFYQSPKLILDSVGKQYPHRVVVSKYKGMQLAVFSKHPIRKHKLINFNETANSIMLSEIDINGHGILLANVHFQTTNINQSGAEISRVKALGVEDPQGQEAFDTIMKRLSKNATQRARQVKIARKNIKDNGDMPVIVCGDFNDIPASYTYREMRKGLTDGFKKAGKGYAYTFSPMYHLFRLDYILYSKDFEAIKYYSDPLPWSDHNPVILELFFPYN